MDNLSLGINEGIIIQHDGVYHDGKYSEIVLTNENLICIEHNRGFFKTTYNVIKYPVNLIKIINGQVQASVIKEADEWVVQVLMKNGIEKFSFSGEFYEQAKKKREADNWVEQFSLLLTGNSATNITDTSLIGSVKSFLGSVGIKAKTKEVVPANVTVRCAGCAAQLSGQKGQKVRCKYCNTEQVL